MEVVPSEAELGGHGFEAGNRGPEAPDGQARECANHATTRARQAGVVSADDAERWWTYLREAQDAGTFFYAFTALIVAGTKG